jgi:hypothetical protein
VLLGYSLLAVALFHNAWAHPASRLIGQCCDSLVGVSYLQSTGVAILHGHQPFVTYYLNAPTGVNAMWQPSSSIALGVVAIPFEWLMGPVATYDLFATLALSLSGWSAYLVLRRWVGGQGGPIVGGLVFGFSSYMTVQSVAGHLDLTFLALVPPALAIVVSLALGRARSPRRAGLVLGALLVVQLLVDQEMLADLMIAAVTVTVVLAVVCRQKVAAAWPHLATGCAYAAAAFLVLGAWPLAAAFFGPLHPHAPILQPSVSPDLLSFVAPSPVINVDPLWIRVADATWFPDAVDQSSAYVGVLLLGVSSLGAVVLRRHKAVVVAALGGVVMAVLSLGPNLRVAGHVTGVPLPWALFRHLPLVRYAVTGRLVAFTWLGVAVIVAALVRAVATGELRFGVAWLTVGAAGLALLFPTSSFAATTLPNPPIFTNTRLVSAIPAGSLAYVAPFPRNIAATIAPMQWQAETRMRFSMPGGYVLVPNRAGTLQSTAIPVDALSKVILDLQAGAAPPPRSTWRPLRAVLVADHAATVVVGPMQHEGTVAMFFTALLGAPPRRVGGVDLWRLAGTDAAVSARAQ